MGLTWSVIYTLLLIALVGYVNLNPTWKLIPNPALAGRVCGWVMVKLLTFLDKVGMLNSKCGLNLYLTILLIGLKMSAIIPSQTINISPNPNMTLLFFLFSGLGWQVGVRTTTARSRVWLQMGVRDPCPISYAYNEEPHSTSNLNLVNVSHVHRIIGFFFFFFIGFGGKGLQH